MKEDLQKVTSQLGLRIRKLRNIKEMKIVDLAEATGLSSSLISQVERGAISPSIETLKNIGNVLGVSVGSLFEESEPADSKLDIEEKLAEISPVVHEHQRKILSPGQGIKFYLLNPNMDGPIEFIYNVYEPGSGTGEGLYQHPGHECGLILEGELEIQIADKKYTLKKGDSITFNSSQPHAKRNKSDSRCLCVWANTPPWF
ncbi:MAG: cupin domain-containing protein [Christensenellales bacterium]|jgi:transcriptional regulator with XRE-family HTH domain